MLFRYKISVKLPLKLVEMRKMLQNRGSLPRTRIIKQDYNSDNCINRKIQINQFKSNKRYKSTDC